jgi:hypothetical protein
MTRQSRRLSVEELEKRCLLSTSAADVLVVPPGPPGIVAVVNTTTPINILPGDGSGNGTIVTTPVIPPAPPPITPIIPPAPPPLTGGTPLPGDGSGGTSPTTPPISQVPPAPPPITPIIPPAPPPVIGSTPLPGDGSGTGTTPLPGDGSGTGTTPLPGDGSGGIGQVPPAPPPIGPIIPPAPPPIIGGVTSGEPGDGGGQPTGDGSGHHGTPTGGHNNNGGNHHNNSGGHQNDPSFPAGFLLGFIPPPGSAFFGTVPNGVVVTGFQQFLQQGPINNLFQDPSLLVGRPPAGLSFNRVESGGGDSSVTTPDGTDPFGGIFIPLKPVPQAIAPAQDKGPTGAELQPINQGQDIQPPDDGQQSEGQTDVVPDLGIYGIWVGDSDPRTVVIDYGIYGDSAT